MTSMAERRIETQVIVTELFGFLDWGGDDWPQPHPTLGFRWNWDTLETEPLQLD